MRSKITTGFWLGTAVLVFTSCSPTNSMVDGLANGGKLTSTSKNSQNENSIAQSDSAETSDAASKRLSATGPGWPLFRGTPESTGVAQTSLPDQLEIVWKFEAVKMSFESTPIIVGGESPTVYVGDLDGRLYALNLDDGKLKWEFKTVSLREGEAQDKPYNGIGFETAPAYRDGKIFIGDLDGIFYCVDSAGKEVWNFQTDGVIHSSANFHGDNVLFGSEDTRLYALDRETGKKSWELETADQVRCSITVVDGTAFVAGCDGGLHMVGLTDGVESASVSIESPTGVTPAVLGDMVFAGTEQSGVFGINWKDSETRWHFNPDGGLATRSSPAVTDNHIVFGSRQRAVFCLNPTTGKERWNKELKANIDSSPVIVGDRVFVGSTDGRFYALSLENGSILWETELRGGIIGSPAVAFGRLIVATGDGVVYCFGSK